MQSEEFDKKIREAASHHHPAYDEQAWDKMHKLLDKHLPEEKDDRRRVLFFLLLFLLLGGGIGIWLLAGRPEKQSLQADVRQTPPQNSSGKNGDKSFRDNVTENNTESSQVIQQNEEVRNEFDQVKNNNETDQVVVSQKNNEKKVVSFDKKKNELTNNENRLIAENKTTNPKYDNEDAPGIKPVKINEPQTNAVYKPTPAGNISEQPVKEIAANEKTGKNAVDNSSEENKKQVSTPAITEEKKAEKKSDAKKTRSKKSSFFFVSLSAGPDVSYTSGGELGTTKVIGGIGLGYTFKNKISLRTGFYSGRKVYAAAPDAYNPPAVFWNYYPYLEKVDADCKVYEIPVLASYHFGKPGKQNWFVSGGLSSLVMKQEDYHYAYKYTPNGTTHYRDWTVKNENKHFFSVATISGGYQKKIGNAVTLTAEPYLKLPLGGVGYGKVKLNSTGILFSVSVKPFQQNKQPGKKP